MNKLIVFFLICAFPVFAQIIQPVTINSYDKTAPTLQYYQANQITIPVYLKNGTNAANLAGCTPFFSWSTGTNGSGISTASCSVVSASNGYFNATFSRSSLNANGYFIYETGATSNGNPIVYRQGVFQLVRSPFAAGVGPLQLSSNIDFSIYNPINAPWILSNQVDGVTLVWVNGVLTSQGAAAPDLTARAAIVAETNRAQKAEEQIVESLTGISNSLAPGASAGLTAVQPATLAGYVATGRTVTINGTAGNLSSNLNFTIAGGTGGGNVASVTGSGGLTNSGLTTGAVVIVLSPATTQSLVKADSALQSESDTLSSVAARGNFLGTEEITPLRVNSKMFGDGAGLSASGSDWCAIGPGAGTLSVGDQWVAVGFGSGIFASWSNSYAFGRFAGQNATGRYRVYIDSINTNATDPGYNPESQSMIYGDEGNLYLGRPNRSVTIRANQINIPGYATNAGNAGEGYYAMSNGVWTLIVPGAGGGTSTGGVTSAQVSNIVNAATAQWATNPATATVFVNTNALVFVGGGKTNTLTFNGTNFISIITP